MCPVVLQSHMVQKELAEEMQQQLTAAEEALAAKQETIDRMKQEIFQKEKELETISVFQAQVSRLLFKCINSSIYLYLTHLKLKHNFQRSVCSVCRQRSIPQTSMQSEQQGRNSMRRRSVWLLSWST